MFVISLSLLKSVLYHELCLFEKIMLNEHFGCYYAGMRFSITTVRHFYRFNFKSMIRLNPGLFQFCYTFIYKIVSTCVITFIYADQTAVHRN